MWLQLVMAKVGKTTDQIFVLRRQTFFPARVHTKTIHLVHLLHARKMSWGINYAQYDSTEVAERVVHLQFI